jgi:beta-lactamase class A
MKNKWLFFVAAVLFILGIGTCIWWNKIANQTSSNTIVDNNDSTLIQRDPNHDAGNKSLDKMISPLLDCEGVSNEISPNFALGLKSEIEKHSKTPGIRNIAVYFRQLKEGMWTGIHEKDQFIPASLLKVPLMIAAYKQLEKEPSFATKKFAFHNGIPPAFPNRILGSKAIKRGNEYTIDELIEYMIVYSDNDAATILKSAISPEILDHVFNDLGIKSVFDVKDVYGISAKDYGSFLRILYNATYLNRYHSAKALEIMSRVEYKNGLVKGINDTNLVVAHKFGERESEQGKQLHDCGIVYTNTPVGDYLVCIMIKGGNEYAPMEKIIQDISNYIHRESQKNLIIK